MCRAIALPTPKERTQEVVKLASRNPALLFEGTLYSSLNGIVFRTHLIQAVQTGLAEVVEIALKAGIHPDDAEAFDGLPLLAPRGTDFNDRFPASAMVAIGLKYGANPSLLVSRSKETSVRPEGLIRALARELRSTQQGHEERAADYMRSIQLLLNAGATNLDGEPGSRRVESPFVLLLGASANTGSEPGMAELQRMHFDLMRQAIAMGARLDASAPPSVWTLVNGDRGESAALLIDLGANLLWNPKHRGGDRNPQGMTLMELAESTCSPFGLAAVREALLRRQIDSALGQRVDATPAPGRRRKPL